jgi:hypothetical protein
MNINKIKISFQEDISQNEICSKLMMNNKRIINYSFTSSLID